MIGYFVIEKNIKEVAHLSLEEAVKHEDPDEDQFIIEVEIKELRRFKKGGWQEVKEKTSRKSR